jgi:hypothetical protein
MTRSRFVIVGIAAAFAAAGTLAVAQTAPPAKDKQGVKAPPAKDHPKPATGTSAAPGQAEQGQMPPLPPGWTEADMQACTVAAMPGPQHAHLAKAIGNWTVTTRMWMAPGMEPMSSTCTSTVTPMFDGRFTKVEWAGDMPGMGPFNGFGIYGFDNVTQKYQTMWIDNCGTMMLSGTGELSSDGTTMTWKLPYTCPITKKLVTMREVEKITGKDTRTMDIYSIDPKTGKEFKMMEAAMTRTAGGPQASAKTISNTKADVGCAYCVFHMPGIESCQLAVMVNGAPYFVGGNTKLDAHQFCKAAKPAMVSGNIEEDWFFASAIDLQGSR